MTNEQPALPGFSAGKSPQLPLANTHDARVDAIYAWYLELIALDDVPRDDAARKAISAAVPNDPAPPMPIAARIIVAVIVAIILVFVAAGLLWFTGNIIVPMFEAATRWI